MPLRDRPTAPMKSHIPPSRGLQFFPAPLEALAERRELTPVVVANQDASL